MKRPSEEAVMTRMEMESELKQLLENDKHIGPDAEQAPASSGKVVLQALKATIWRCDTAKGREWQGVQLCHCRAACAGA